MQSDTALQTLLRCLPAILVLVIGFLAMNDAGSRRQWTQFLFSIGSLRADQRENAQKQATVKFPFFIMAFFLLWWPVSYYRHATRKIDVISESEIFKKPAQEAPAAATPTPKPTPSGPTPPPAPLAPGQTAAAAPPASLTPMPAAPAPSRTPGAPAPQGFR